MKSDSALPKILSVLMALYTLNSGASNKSESTDTTLERIAKYKEYQKWCVKSAACRESMIELDSSTHISLEKIDDLLNSMDLELIRLEQQLK